MSLLGTAHESLVYRRRIRRLSELLSEFIPQGCRVLDIGCGDGKLAYALLQKRADLRVEGVDVLVRLRTAVPVKRFDGSTLPYAACGFDAVTLVDVLHHTRDPLLLLREALRVSRRWLIVKDHILQGAAAALRLRWMDYVGNTRHGVALPYKYLTASQWNELQENLNVRTIKEERRLALYPPPIDYIFGAGLHFIALWERNIPCQQA